MGLKSNREVNVYMVCIAIEPYLTKATLGLEAIYKWVKTRMNAPFVFVCRLAVMKGSGDFRKTLPILPRSQTSLSRCKFSVPCISRPVCRVSRSPLLATKVRDYSGRGQ